MKNRGLSQVISVLICISLVFCTLLGANGIATAATSKATSGSAGGKTTWSYNAATKTLTISGTGATNDYNAALRKVPWESYKSELTKVVVDEGVTILGNYCFYNCTSLTSVQLPSTLTEIHGMGTTDVSYGCFQGCTALTSITFPEKLTKIGTCAFKGCTSLKSVKIPDSVTTLDNGAFCDCTALTNVVYGTGLTSTGVNAFSNSGVKNVTFTSSITSIDMRSFYTTNLIEVELPESVTSIGAQSFGYCGFLTKVTVNNAKATFTGDSFGGSKQDLTFYGHKNSTTETYATEHSYGFVSIDSCDHLTTREEITKEATCTEKGEKNIICSDCGQIVDTVEIPALGHNYAVTGTEDKTTEDGHIYTNYTCSRCNDTYAEPEHQLAPDGSATKYVWIEGKYTYSKRATCTTGGTETYTCNISGCNKIETNRIPAGSHTVEEWTVTKKPTCTEKGSRTGTCTTCGSTVTESIAATGHTYDENNPTATDDKTTEDGHIYKTYTCTTCGATVEKTEHVAWVDGKFTPNVITQPTCTVNGLERDTCDICGETRNVTLPSNGQHTWELTSTSEATCTARGTKVYTCSVCGRTYTEYTDALGHDYVKSEADTVQPTCTAAGSALYKCSRCSSTKTEVLPATGHTPDESTYKVTTEPTCEKEGSATATCSVCKTEYTITLDALGHDYQDVAVAIEDKPGHNLVTPTCSRCGNKKTATVVHAEWVDGYYTTKVVKEAGCLDGASTDTCTICNTTRTNTLPAMGHNYVYTGSQSSDGRMIYRCSYCNMLDRESPASVLSMWSTSYMNTTPKRTAYDDSSYLDANGDGYINAMDYAMIVNANKKTLNTTTTTTTTTAQSSEN